MIKILNHHTLCIQMKIICMDRQWEIGKQENCAIGKLPINGFEWVEELSKFDKRFINNYHKNSNKGYILEVHVEYPKNLFNLYKDLPFLAKARKLKITRNLFVTYITKKTILYT